MSKRTKIIARTISSTEYAHYRIWDNGDVELHILESNSWSLVNPLDNTDLWKKNIRKLIPGKRYRFMSWHPNSPFESCFREVAPNNNFGVILAVHGFDPVKCTECGSENTKDSRCFDCGEWL